MRTLLLSTICAVLIVTAFSSCTTTVKTPSGRTTSVSTKVQH